MVDAALYDGHVVVGVVEDWEEDLRHGVDIDVRWLAHYVWVIFGCFFEQRCNVGGHRGGRGGWDRTWRIRQSSIV